jgi:tRNA dimethylallyltransferase
MHYTLIIGPTAVGKSTYALDLAEQLQADIISMDALQVYRYMDIGTAKISLQDRRGIPHHLIDIVNPDTQYSVADYIQAVKSIVEQARRNNKNLVFCGGTGLYLNALINGLALPGPGQDQAYRDELKKKTNEELWQKLQASDPTTARRLHPNDQFRIIRALEIHHLSGQPMSALAGTEPSILGTNYTVIGLTTDREKIYRRIEQRDDQMIDRGLVDEVKGLLAKGYSPALSSLQALGYKEIIGYLSGLYSLDEAVSLIKKGTRHFAKRQYTWFRRFNNIQWKEITWNS